MKLYRTGKKLVTALMALFLATPLWAQSNPDLSISALISRGYVTQAHDLMMAGNPSDADKVFFVGQVLKSQRKLKEAIEVFREVLRIDPTYINARRELAHSLLLNRNYAAAELHFNTLLRIDQNASMRRGYQAFLNAINQYEPWRFGSFVAIKPSTNINSGTTLSELETVIGRFRINEESKAKSGVGADLGLSATYTKPLSATSELTTTINGVRTRYNDPEFDSDYARISSKFTQRTNKGKWSLGIFIDRNWQSDTVSSNAKGAEFQWDRYLGSNDTLSIGLARQLSRYPQQEYKDGSLERYSFSYSKSIDASLNWNGGLGLELAEPTRDSNQYFTQRLFGGVNKVWQGGLITGLGAELGQRNYRANYPLTNAPRADEYKKVWVSAFHSKVQLWGLAPKLTCSFTDQISNVAFFQFTSTSCNASLSQDF